MASESNASDRVVTLCRTYVAMSVKHPGCAAVMFRRDRVERTDEAYVTAANASFTLLKSAVADAIGLSPAQETVELASRSLWAAMHGFVVLSLAEGGNATRVIDFAVRTVLNGAVR